MGRKQGRPKRAMAPYIFTSCQAVFTERLPLPTGSRTGPHSVTGYLRAFGSMETTSEKQPREKVRFDSVILAGAIRKAALHHPNHELKSWGRSKNASTNRPSISSEGKRTPRVSRSAGRRRHLKPRQSRTLLSTATPRLCRCTAQRIFKKRRTENA